MSKPKFTDARWEACHDCTNSVTIRDSYGEQIALVCNDDGDDLVDEDLERAHVIAASPRLYAKLAEAIENEDLFMQQDTYQAWRERVRAALAGARGEKT